MIRFHYNEIKATQAAAYLLKKNSGILNYMKLIKLLYLSDREALSAWERPITGDSFFSMTHGPVLSKTLDKINSGKNPSEKSYWHEHISTPSNYKVKLKSEPGVDELSKREKDVLDRIFNKYEKYDEWEMVDICHKILSEWEDPGDTSISIAVEDILKATKKTAIEIALIEEEVASINFVNQLLSTPSSAPSF